MAIAVDLPGHGDDKTSISEISLQSYADRVCRVLDAQSEPVILVGHSMGGTVITQAAEYCPDKIKALIYLCAFVPRNGESHLQLAMQDKDSSVGQNLIMAEDKSYCTTREKAIKDARYGDCSDEDVTRAKSLLCPDPMIPLVTPVDITAVNYGRIPRVYIECLRDRALTPPFQKQMYGTQPFRRIISMNTSHSPFFSAPKELAGYLTINVEQASATRGRAKS